MSRSGIPSTFWSKLSCSSSACPYAAVLPLTALSRHLLANPPPPASIGVALPDHEGHTIDDLLRNADAAAARKEAKADGRATYRLFTQGM